jgi:hypothetical protein
MRTLILPIALALSLLAATAATAAPTCETRSGETIRCATAGAMPVGWALPSDERVGASSDEDPSPAQWFELISLVGGLFALIALMPDFDRWDAQSEDGEEQA